jgi:hypothetical protein
LTGDKANPARGGVNEDHLAFADFVDLTDEVLHGQAFEHHRRGLLVRDAFGEHHQPIGRHDAHFAIGPEGATGVGDAVARLDIFDTWADRLDYAGGFGSDTAWQRHGVKSFPDIDIDVVEPHRGVAHARLARAGFADVDLFPHQHFESTGLVETDALGHVPPPASGYRPARQLPSTETAAVLHKAQVATGCSR